MDLNPQNENAKGPEDHKVNIKKTKLDEITKLFSSASKIVFIAMALAVIAALFTGNITGEQFMVLAGMTFAFYFSNKGEVSKPFAGK
mgnify:CR=1 FL=1